MHWVLGFGGGGGLKMATKVRLPSESFRNQKTVCVCVSVCVRPSSHLYVF